MSFLLRILIAVVLISLLEFYFIRKIKVSFKEYFPEYPTRILKRLLFGILIFFNLYPAFLTGTWIFSTVFNVGRMDLPQNFFFDYLLTYPFWIGVIIIVQSSLFFILFDLAGGLLMLFAHKQKKAALRKIELRFLPFIALAFIVYVPARIIYDYHSIQVNYIKYVKNTLPSELNNFRLILISDIQADKYTNTYRLGKFVEKVNQQKPDLVLIAGDLITSTPTYIELSAEFTGKIKSSLGTFTCVGDHDNWAYREDNARSIREITQALARRGVKMIDNDKELFNYKNRTISVTFITNTYVERIDNEMLNQLTNGNDKSDLKIFLTHQPRNYLIDNAVKNNYDLYLAGHTHGGQITFLFPFINLSPTLIETVFVKGRFDFDNMMLYVTRGLGMSLVPIRYNSTPEITVITFSDK